MRLSVHCLGGSLPPGRDGLKPNSCLPPGAVTSYEPYHSLRTGIKHQVSSIEHRASSIEHQVSSISTCFSIDLLLAGVSLIGRAFSAVCSTGSTRSAETLLLLWTLSIIE